MSRTIDIRLANITPLRHAHVFLIMCCAGQKIGAHFALNRRIEHQQPMCLIAIKLVSASDTRGISIHGQRSATAFYSIPIVANVTILSNTSQVTAVSYMKA